MEILDYSKKEDTHQEFKVITSLNAIGKYNIIKTMMAFANKEGGKLIIGVDDENFNEIPINEDVKNSLSNKELVGDLLRSFVTPMIDFDIVPYINVIVIKVKKSNELIMMSQTLHHAEAGDAFIRGPHNTQKMRASETKKRIEEASKGISFSIKNELKSPFHLKEYEANNPRELMVKHVSKYFAKILGINNYNFDKYEAGMGMRSIINSKGLVSEEKLTELIFLSDNSWKLNEMRYKLKEMLNNKSKSFRVLYYSLYPIMNDVQLVYSRDGMDFEIWKIILLLENINISFNNWKNEVKFFNTELLNSLYKTKSIENEKYFEKVIKGINIFLPEDISKTFSHRDVFNVNFKMDYGYEDFDNFLMFKMADYYSTYQGTKTKGNFSENYDYWHEIILEESFKKKNKNVLKIFYIIVNNLSISEFKKISNNYSYSSNLMFLLDETKEKFFKYMLISKLKIHNFYFKTLYKELDVIENNDLKKLISKASKEISRAINFNIFGGNYSIWTIENFEEKIRQGIDNLLIRLYALQDYVPGYTGMSGIVNNLLDIKSSALSKRYWKTLERRLEKNKWKFKEKNIKIFNKYTDDEFDKFWKGATSKIKTIEEKVIEFKEWLKNEFIKYK